MIFPVHDFMIKKSVLDTKASTSSVGTIRNEPFLAHLVPGKGATRITPPQTIIHTSTNPSDKTSSKLATVSLQKTSTLVEKVKVPVLLTVATADQQLEKNPSN